MKTIDVKENGVWITRPMTPEEEANFEHDFMCELENDMEDDNEDDYE